MSTLREFIEAADTTAVNIFNERGVLHGMYHFVGGLRNPD